MIAEMSLTTMKRIVVAVYGVALIVYPIIGGVVNASGAVAAQTANLLGQILVAVGIGTYATSLMLERVLLRKAGSMPSPRARAGTTALIVAAMGESLAIFGLVLALLGASGWALALYLMCLVHGVHLLMRWSSYEAAAESDPYQP